MQSVIQNLYAIELLLIQLNKGKYHYDKQSVSFPLRKLNCQ